MHRCAFDGMIVWNFRVLHLASQLLLGFKWVFDGVGRRRVGVEGSVAGRRNHFAQVFFCVLNEGLSSPLQGVSEPASI